jgi:hypothetical protein
MLTPRLTNSLYYDSIPVLLQSIDSKLAELANDQYNNITLSLNYPIPGQVIEDLLRYKQILTYKECNIDYCINYTVDMIASRVNILIHK